VGTGVAVGDTVGVGGGGGVAVMKMGVGGAAQAAK
jgi:hypothetical protein